MNTKKPVPMWANWMLFSGSALFTVGVIYVDMIPLIGGTCLVLMATIYITGEKIIHNMSPPSEPKPL